MRNHSEKHTGSCPDLPVPTQTKLAPTLCFSPARSKRHPTLTRPVLHLTSTQGRVYDSPKRMTTRRRSIWVNSVAAFLQQLQALDLFPREQCLFRGHATWNWQLLPLIARKYRKPGNQGYDTWYTLELEFTTEFRRLSRPWLEQINAEWLDVLMVGQHYRLPTRLLDWTTNPLKALFFAVEDRNNLHDGAVWTLPIHTWGPAPDLPEDIDTLVPIVSPPQLDTRVIAQESCFTLFPYPKGDAAMVPLESAHWLVEPVAEPLLQFRIPKARKESIRWELRQLGITHRSLFPGLEGVAASIAAREDDASGFNLTAPDGR